MKLRRFLLRAALTLLVAIVLFEVTLRLTPIPAALTHPPSDSAEFLDRHGQPLRLLLAEGKRHASRIALAEISPRLIEATLAAEDQRFRQHHGIDFLATSRAISSAIRQGHAGSGASTITQQLVKLALPGPRTFPKKFSEIWLALRLERAWTKDRILTEYLNRLDYGNLQIGAGPASRYYFAKPPADLSAAEAAFLAGLPQAPSRLDPHDHFTAARQRQLWVLSRMLATSSLDPNGLQRAKTEPLLLQPPRQEFEAPHFVDLLLTRRGLMPPGGGPIRTTLDLELNHFVEQSLTQQLASLTDKNATSGAAVVIHNPTGEVLALAGSGDYFRAGAGQVNGACIARSPGSAVKPFTYLLALQNGAFPGTIVADVPTDFPTTTGLYRPNNYNHRFYGPVSLRFALGNSLNVAAIQTVALAGGPEALHRCLRELGITTLGHPADYYGPGLTLGNAEMRLLELANAFATLGRLGVYRPFRLLLRENGDASPEKRVFDPRAAFLLADMLSDNTARAASFGLNSWLSFDFPVACKTGTSSDYRDNWTIGYTPEFTVAVWVGNPDSSPMRGITGVTGAAPVMHDVMVHLHEQRGTSWFREPEGLLREIIDPLTGHRVTAGRPGAVTEKSLRPLFERPSDYDSQGRVILPPAYADWLASPQNGLGNLVVCSTSAHKLRITNPPPGSIYFLDPDLPLATQRIPLQAEAAGPVQWSSQSLSCEIKGRAQLREGTHTIIAHDPRTGQTASTWIEVRGW